ncbi:MAG TPA: alpha/beta fold hydrolase [Candidatus Cybelea sp.]|nr:alpha/beta fold hydrolase [Candidatus Cybelea sp.]
MERLDLEVPALDGTPLRATLFEAQSPSKAVIVGGATAVPRGFYDNFAAHLAERGVSTLTYDYRGSGGSARELRGSAARMRDWGALDFPGAIAWMRERYPAVPLHVVGHSAGGHALLMTPNGSEITSSVTVATQLGYWRLCAPGERYRVWLLLNTLAPLLVLATGYVPGAKLGLGENIASGVMRDWRKWIGSPNYFFDDPTMRETLAGATYRAPTLIAGMSDDTWGTPHAVDAFAKYFDNAQRLTVEPQAYGLGAVGHFGFFRSRNGPALWPIVTRYLGIEDL